MREELAEIQEKARRAGMPATALRVRGDRRRRRFAVTGAGLGIVLLAGGCYAVTRPDRQPEPVAQTPSSAVPLTGAKLITAALAGERLVRIGVEDGTGTALILGADDDDKVYARDDTGAEDRSTWLLLRRGAEYQVMLATKHGTDNVCMTAVHDAAPGTVRDRVCDAGNAAQLFTVERVGGGISLFQGKHYVQVVDGPRTLVPDLPEALTTTYTLEDRGVPD